MKNLVAATLANPGNLKGVLEWARTSPITDEEALAVIGNIITVYGNVESADNKQWVLDQILRVLYGENQHYQDWINLAFDPGSWDVGVEP